MQEVLYYIPKKTITRKAKINLYRVLKSKGVYQDRYKIAYFIALLLSDIKTLKKIIKNKDKLINKEPTKKQVRALNNIVFGGHYSIDVYIKIINKFFGVKKS